MVVDLCERGHVEGGASGRRQRDGEGQGRGEGTVMGEGMGTGDGDGRDGGDEENSGRRVAALAETTEDNSQR